jgi:hypothetical protein
MAARPGDELSVAAAGLGQLRASHADREQVVDTLKAAFVQGMLAKDEFDLRVGQTLASKTYAQLAALRADLPAGLTLARPPTPARAGGEMRIPRPGRLLTAATVIYAGIWPLGLLLPANSEGEPGLALITMTGLAYIVVVLILLAQISMDWQDKRARRRPPKGHASGAGGARPPSTPSAGPARPRGQSPPAASGRWRAAEAARPRPPVVQDADHAWSRTGSAGALGLAM